MEIVILVSVLSTLGVVALVTAIVVAFTRMKKKVDDRESNTNREFERVYNYIEEKNKVLDDQISILTDRTGRDIEGVLTRVRNGESRIEENVKKEIVECYSFIDSRCDKLDRKISGKKCKKETTEKQLLTD